MRILTWVSGGQPQSMVDCFSFDSIKMHLVCVLRFCGALFIHRLAVCLRCRWQRGAAQVEGYLVKLLRFFSLLLIALLLPLTANAQDEAWRELRTSHFAILYANGDQATAESYKTFVDAIYDETSAIFGHHAATPLTLRLYPTWESYVAVNPLARGMQGIVAHADYQRHEVVVVVSQTARQNETEVENNIRHELTHIIASDLSDNRLNVLFQEGIAQYVEHAAPELETRIRLLQNALDNDRLLRWSDLDDRQTFYGESEVAYPQSLSIVAFLIEKYSFASFRTFLTTSAKSSGYRSALERSYNIAADQLETAWRAWLPSLHCRRLPTERGDRLRSVAR